MKFLIFFEDSSGGFRVARESLLESLASAWPDATLVADSRMGVTTMRDVGWTYTSGDAVVEGWSAESGEGLSLEGDEELVAEFAAWFRALVPAELAVRICDAMYTFEFEITPGASAVQIAQQLAEA